MRRGNFVYMYGKSWKRKITFADCESYERQRERADASVKRGTLREKPSVWCSFNAIFPPKRNLKVGNTPQERRPSVVNETSFNSTLSILRHAFLFTFTLSFFRWFIRRFDASVFQASATITEPFCSIVGSHPPRVKAACSFLFTSDIFFSFFFLLFRHCHYLQFTCFLQTLEITWLLSSASRYDRRLVHERVFFVYHQIQTRCYHASRAMLYLHFEQNSDMTDYRFSEARFQFLKLSPLTIRVN